MVIDRAVVEGVEIGGRGDVPNDVVEMGKAGFSAVFENDDGGDGGDEVGDGREVRGEVNADGESDEEGAAEEEHLVAAEMITGHDHWN